MKNKILKKLRVLFVEDEENIARLLKNAIGDSFYSFTLASNGKDGIEKFLQISPDIVITDINMPYMSGLDMARELKKIDKSIPIIILSAFSEKEKLFEAIDVGVVKYFLKPYDPDDILDYINLISIDLEDKLVQLSDGFSFNKTSKSLYQNSKFIPLLKNEIKFFTLILNTKDNILNIEAIKKEIWNEEVSDDRLRTFIKRLRVKTSKKLIINLKGIGYKII